MDTPPYRKVPEVELLIAAAKSNQVTHMILDLRHAIPFKMTCAQYAIDSKLYNLGMPRRKEKT